MRKFFYKLKALAASFNWKNNGEYSFEEIAFFIFSKNTQCIDRVKSCLSDTKKKTHTAIEP